MKTKPNVDSLFSRVIELETPQSRLSFLERACGEDVELRRQVERLVHAHFRGGSIVDSPNREFAPTVLPESQEKPGCRIGPYKLLQQIGEGGMGVVYMAEMAGFPTTAHIAAPPASRRRCECRYRSRRPLSAR
jgi:eukaryotic-like serine/threonine-protein kinase